MAAKEICAPTIFSKHLFSSSEPCLLAVWSSIESTYISWLSIASHYHVCFFNREALGQVKRLSRPPLPLMILPIEISHTLRNYLFLAGIAFTNENHRAYRDCKKQWVVTSILCFHSEAADTWQITQRKGAKTKEGGK
jgi:hypothetical protein